MTAIGCANEPPASAPPPEPVVAEPPEPLLAPPVEPELAAQPAAVEPSPPPARKLAVFTPSGLLYLDLAITVDGRPLAAAVRAFAERLVAAADADGDGVASWDELTDNRSFLAGPLGGGASQTSRSERRRWRELYDVDGDGRVDPPEALAWAQRDGRESPIGLTLLGGRAYTPSVVASATWRTLDADGSGALSDEEARSAPERLLARDVNDDRVLVPSELLSLADLARLRQERGPLAGMGPTSSYNDAAFRSALLVDREADARDAQSTLASFGGSPTDPGVLGFAERLAAALDADGNGYVVKSEWALLLGAAAHARLDAAFPAGESGPLKLTGEASEARLAIESDPREASRFRVRIAPTANDPGGVLLVAAVDEGGPGPLASRVAEVFERFDEDGDDKLNAEELAAGAARLGGLNEETLGLYDADDDNAADRGEVAAYLADVSARDRLSVSIVVNDAADPHFATLDADGDGRLGEREIAAADDALREAAASGDARLDAAPWRMRLNVYRTRRRLDGSETPPPAAYRSEATDAPAWFTGADTNRDGDLSPREFIGGPEAFADYDANGDGYVTAAEAALQ